MKFVGVDLAWSDNNETGLATLRYDDGLVLDEIELVESDDEIVSLVEAHSGGCHVAIDAPLVVPNEEGRRPAEDVTSKLFRSYDAGPYPANRNWLEKASGRVRGEDISNALEKVGFDHKPSIDERERSDVFFEVYPHPSMVVLFGLNKSLKYKDSKGRSYEERYNAFQTYIDNLKDLDIKGLDDVVDIDFKELRGGSLKRFEDKLDAIFCAYIAYYNWKNPEDCRILGNKKEGYILSPVFEETL